MGSYHHILSLPPPDDETLLKHAWNFEDRSLNIETVEDDPFTFHRFPAIQSTDGIRGKFGYSRGVHVWKLVWPHEQRGTHPMVGIATKDASLHNTGYVTLIGKNAESWGWNLGMLLCVFDLVTDMFLL